MADLSTLQSTISSIIMGSDSTGAETNPLAVDATGSAQTIVNNGVGAASVNIQDGGNSITVDATTLPLPTGASTSTLQTTGNTSVASIDTKTPVLGQATMTVSTPVVIASNQSILSTTNPSQGINNTTIPSSSTLIGGSDGTNTKPLAVDSLGRLITTSITGFGSNFIFGDITTAALTQVKVERTAYVEQSTNAQRSIVSASANDTAAGTGARTVKIFYLDQTGAGPFSEIITLNGLTAVNTIATNICFIEQIEVLTVGTTGSNVGILSLKTTTAGGGTNIATINALENQTYWTHHYIPTGKTCNITGMSVSHNGTTVGSGGLFIVKAQAIPVANQVDLQVSGFVRLYGQSGNNTRNYTSPIKVVGPARITSYVTPETTTATVYRSSVDFFEP